MDKIKILSIPKDSHGVGYFRSIKPHKSLYEKYGDIFHVVIDNSFDFNDKDFFKQFNIISFNNFLLHTIEENENLFLFFKENNIKTVVDIDDYWNLGIFHPLHFNDKINKEVSNLIIHSIKNADVVTTTTEFFAHEIRKINKNVVVIPNAIDLKEPQFIPQPTNSKKLRLGLVMGSSHLYDVSILKDMINKFTKDELEKIQIVLCGFDVRGCKNVEKSVWVEYEKILTNNYTLISEDYKNFLKKYTPNSVYPNNENEMYNRYWTKSITDYATHYNNIDILLAPLKDCQFNKFKSQLKAIEAGVFSKGIIAQNIEPYKIDLVSITNKGGTINQNGNSILIDSNSNHKDWYKAVKLLLNQPMLLKTMENNLHKHVIENYDLENVTDMRKLLYENINKN